MAKSNTEIAVETRTKFEFYLLALIFTILGLSIQTAKFGENAFADSFELAGWVCLAFAGTMGLLRGEWIPVAYEIFGKIESTEDHVGKLRQAQEQGIAHTTTFLEEDGTEVELNVEQSIARLEALLENLRGQRMAAEARIRNRYWWMKWGLLIGIAALMLARGTAPAVGVSQRLGDCYFGPFARWSICS